MRVDEGLAGLDALKIHFGSVVDRISLDVQRSQEAADPLEDVRDTKQNLDVQVEGGINDETEGRRL